MISFQDNASQAMTDLLKVLLEEAKTASTADDAQATESVYSVLLRLIGISRRATLNIQKDANNKINTESSTEFNLIDNLFKIQNKATEQQLINLNALLKTYKQRLLRYSKNRQTIKLNRTQKLVQKPQKPLNVEELVKQTPDQTKKAIAEAQKKLIQEGDIAGIIQQDLILFKALEQSIAKATPDVAENSADRMQAQLNNIVQSAGKEANNYIEKLSNYNLEIQSEIKRLQNEQNLLFQGSSTFSGDNQKLSLLNVIDLLIFLTDRKNMRYECSQCKFFIQGRNNSICSYAGTDSATSANITTILDPTTGNNVTGKQTRSTNSCKQTWGLETNNYHQLSDKIVDQILKQLEST